MSPKETAEWFLHIDGQQRGPYRLTEVRQYLAGGSVIAEDMVWGPTSERWRPAGEVFFDFFNGPEKSKPWYREASNVIAAISLLVAVGLGLLTLPFLSDFWQQTFVGGPLDQYKSANAKTFLSTYEGEWCAEGPVAGIPGRVRISPIDAKSVKFVFGNLVSPMSIPGRTAEPAFFSTHEGATKRILTDGKSAYFVEFENEIYPGVASYEQLYLEGAKNLWRRYYTKDNKNELVFQAELKRCS